MVRERRIRQDPAKICRSPRSSPRPSCALAGCLASFSAWKRASCGAWCAGYIVNRKRMTVFYSGNVQGVGFRYTVTTVATGFEVTGTVGNLPDRRVELIAEGPGEELEAFRRGIRESGLRHFIKEEEAVWGEARDEFAGLKL